MKNIVTLGQINDALKIASVTAAQLAEMGFAALENKPICEALPPEESRRLRSAKLYPVESIAQIRVALAKRLAAPACSLLQIQEPVPGQAVQHGAFAALLTARGALQHLKEGGKPAESLLETALTAIDSVVIPEAKAAVDAPVAAWTPTVESINALPEPLRAYIHELETNADPAGTVRDNTILRDQLSGLQIMFRKSQDALSAQAAPVAVGGREAFETALRKHSPHAHLECHEGQYASPWVQTAWTGFQLSAAPAATPEDHIADAGKMVGDHSEQDLKMAEAPVEHLDMDRVLSIADVHAEESREDGVRLLDRGGLVAFASDVLRAATPAADAPMVNMTPPATSRDRWMYEQGRLAERDARTHGNVAAAAPVVLPEPFALYDGEKWYANEEAAICSCADMAKLQKVFIESQLLTLLAGVSAPAAQVVPDGWTLVPVDLTPEMKREFMDLLMDGIDIYVNRRDQIEIQTDAPRRIWKAVLALSPAAPQAQADARDAAPAVQARFDLTVNQMRQAIEFATGGFTPDTEDELETSLTFCVGPLQMDEAGTNIQECTHCWLTDLAEEGAIPLDEYPTAQDLAKAQATAASEQDARVQWWLATLNQYGNPTLTDGAHQERAGADKAAYLIDAMNLGRGKKYAVARVELSEPKPSSDGVNHDAIAMHNRSAQAAQQGGAA